MSYAQAHHVAVLMGGLSEEREISLLSGQECSKALRSVGWKVSEVDAGVDLPNALMSLAPDAVFNALHGPLGEDGCVQGLLEVMRKPYTHSGVLASALAMNKALSKRIFREAGLPVAAGIVALAEEVGHHHLLTPPYVVKPLNQGSACGVLFVGEGHPPPRDVLQDDWRWKEVMVERYVPGRELSCAVMDGNALGVIEIQFDGPLFDYRAKYEEGVAHHIMPADISEEVRREVCRLSEVAHEVLGCRGVTRADLRYDDSKPALEGLVILETNTQPGMTARSLVPEIAGHQGISYQELVKWIVEDASCNR